MFKIAVKMLVTAEEMPILNNTFILRDVGFTIGTGFDLLNFLRLLL